MSRPDTTAAVPALNLKQVATRLGVHYMTAYRYVRQGRLEAERVGTEWRVSAEALLRFAAAPSGAAAPAADWAARLERCLLAGDETAAWRTVEGALAAGRDPVFCYVDMLGGALAAIGDRFEHGGSGLADQHVATAVAMRIVARLGARFRRPGRSRGAVVFGAPVGELHSLPIAIAADVVRLGGFDVRELGSNVPPEAFAAAAAGRGRLVCVGIGLTSVQHLESLRATVEALRLLDPAIAVVVGGLGAGAPEIAELAGISAVALDGREALAVVESLAPPGRAKRRGAPGQEAFR